MSAIISDCGAYRCTLERDVAMAGPLFLFIGGDESHCCDRELGNIGVSDRGNTLLAVDKQGRFVGFVECLVHRDDELAHSGVVDGIFAAVRFEAHA